MDRETARQEIRQRVSCKKYLEKSKHGNYICPFCGSGTGEHKTGALKLRNSNLWQCYSCKKYGDVIDLYTAQTGATYNTALEELAAEAGITIDRTPEFKHIAARQSNEQKKDREIAHPTQKEAQRGAEGKTDYTEYYRACSKRIYDAAARDYLAERRISVATAEAYNIGFDPQADPARSNHPCPRIIIPTSPEHYIARSIDPKTPKAFSKMNPKGATPAIFNPEVLYKQEVQEVFITEGAFDALSVIEMGQPAIALNSAANADALIKMLEQQRTDATLILCLDNDDRGQQATATLKTGLQRLNISYITADICKGYKDPNEALQKDVIGFFDALEQVKRKTAPKPDNTAFYIDTFMQEDIKHLEGSEAKTCFNNLNEKAGGIYSGLYVLAAISSLGKTTFALQIADGLAASGKDVLFFSLEQSRLELVSKSLARVTAQNNMENAACSLSIRKGYLTADIKQAISEYKEQEQDRMNIIEGNFNCDIAYISEYTRQFIKRNKTRPVIFIDYLQVLQPAEKNQRQSLKENIDQNVTELKRLSRELDLTVFVISSVNRANYLTPIDFESLKESGGIEYTADVIWGLQLSCLNEDIFDKANNIKEKRARIKEAKAETPRKIELSCLKNRYGIASFSCYFEYYPAHDLFKESAAPEFAEIEWDGEINDEKESKCRPINGFKTDFSKVKPTTKI